MGMSKCNAYEEYITHIEDRAVLQAIIYKGGGYYNKPSVYALLLNDAMYDKFISQLKAIEYNDGYGGQELFGVIWYKDGTYSERSEYDGSEWWSYRSMPDFSIMYNELMSSLLSPEEE
jgi:hypothetical protein